MSHTAKRSHTAGDETAFVRGPWHAEGRQVWRLDGGIRPVCNVFGAPVVPISGPEQEATARLIAAAPDLLQAAEDLLAAFGDDWAAAVKSSSDAVRALERAVCKAKGAIP